MNFKREFTKEPSLEARIATIAQSIFAQEHPEEAQKLIEEMRAEIEWNEVEDQTSLTQVQVNKLLISPYLTEEEMRALYS